MQAIDTPNKIFINGTRREPGTPVTAEWLNGVQGEILNVIEAAGIEPSNENDQLNQAIDKKIQEEIKYNEDLLEKIKRFSVPLGAIVSFPAGTQVNGYLKLDGSTFDASTYPQLHRFLGGNTLPNLIGSDVGMTSFFPGDQAPSGWLEFDQIQTVTAKNYPELHAYLIKKFGSIAAVPKVGDRFIRGAGSGLEVGALQDDQVKEHYHKYARGHITSNVDWDDHFSNGHPNVLFDRHGDLDNHGDIAKTSPFGGSETRPKAIVLKLYIKAKNQFDGIEYWIRSDGVAAAGTDNGIADIFKDVALKGRSSAPTAAIGDASHLIANTFFVHQAISAYKSVDVSSDVELAVNDARNNYLTFVGQKETDTTVTLPKLPSARLWLIRNVSSAANKVFLSQGSTKIEIPRGYCFVYSNSSSVEMVFSSSSLKSLDYVTLKEFEKFKSELETSNQQKSESRKFGMFAPKTTEKPAANIVSMMSRCGTRGWNFGSANLNETTDDGETWELVHTFAGYQTNFIFELANGELIASVQNKGGGAVFVSDGYPQRKKKKEEWSKVLTSHSKFVKYTGAWSFFADENLVLLIDYGGKAGHQYGGEEVPLGDNARYAYLSLDYGKSFKRIFDLNEFVKKHGYADTGVHCHGIAYDKWWHRIWITFGDNAYGIGGTIYSDDFGKNWQWANKGKDSQSSSPSNSRHQNVGIKPMQDCILFGTDCNPNGVHMIDRAQGKHPKGEYTIDIAYRYNQDDALTHLCQSIWQNDEGVNRPVLMGFSSEGSTQKSFVVATYNGKDVQKIWESPSGTARGMGIRSVVGPTKMGNFIFRLTDVVEEQIKHFEIKGEAPIFGL